VMSTSAVCFYCGFGRLIVNRAVAAVLGAETSPKTLEKGQRGRVLNARFHRRLVGQNTLAALLDSRGFAELSNFLFLPRSDSPLNYRTGSKKRRSFTPEQVAWTAQRQGFILEESV
jgi:hypothetical protein